MEESVQFKQNKAANKEKKIIILFFSDSVRSFSLRILLDGGNMNEFFSLRGIVTPSKKNSYGWNEGK